MAQERKSLFSRIMEGDEKNEDYARSTLPQNRWQLFWDILKGRIGKVCIANLLMLIFFLPLLAVVVMRGVFIQSQGLTGPYGANLTVGYPGIPDITGVWEGFMFSTNSLFFGGVVVASFIAAIGLSGGIYVIRNMIWTEGIFIANDFWKGIKKNYLTALAASVFFSLFLYLAVYVSSLADYMTAQGVGNETWFTIAKVACTIITVLVGFMSLWMLSLGVNYHQSPVNLIKNAFIMTVGTFPQTVVFAACAILPYLLLLSGVSLLVSVGIVAILLIAFSYSLLVWMSFSQWAFDKFVNTTVVKGAKTGRGLYNPNKSEATENSEESSAMHAYKLAMIKEGRSNLMSRPMKPIDDELTVYELPTSFSREDLQKLRESKKAITDDQKAYELEHKNDTKYVEYNKQFDEREKALQPERDKKGKIKKTPAPKMLNQQ